MTLQPLWQQTSGMVATDGTLTLQFPPVPQGLVWTGSLTLYAPFLAGSNQSTLQPGIWNLTRGGQPVISFSGEAVLSDVQAVAQDVLQISGKNLSGGTMVYATWTGWSGDPIESPLVYPKVYGQQTKAVQVYTDSIGGPGSALDTVPNPSPVDVQSVQTFADTSGSYTMLTAPYPGYLSLWHVALNVSAAYDGTTAAAYPCLVSLAINGVNLLSIELLAVQGTAVTESQDLACYGLYIPGGQTLVMSVGGFGGTTMRANATAVYV